MIDLLPLPGMEFGEDGRPAFVTYVTEDLVGKINEIVEQSNLQEKRWEKLDESMAVDENKLPLVDFKNLVPYKLDQPCEHDTKTLYDIEKGLSCMHCMAMGYKSYPEKTCRCHCHNMKAHSDARCRCIKNCTHCHPENFKPAPAEKVKIPVMTLPTEDGLDNELVPVDLTDYINREKLKKKVEAMKKNIISKNSTDEKRYPTGYNQALCAVLRLLEHDD